LWIISRGCSVTVVFRSRKGYFQRLISRLRKLTLTRDLHQWKIWSFYLPRIPSLGGWRTNAWPANPAWRQPTLPFPKNYEYIMSGETILIFLGIIRFTVLYRFLIMFGVFHKVIWLGSYKWFSDTITTFKKTNIICNFDHSLPWWIFGWIWSTTKKSFITS
jgi:hypothetical protein